MKTLLAAVITSLAVTPVLAQDLSEDRVKELALQAIMENPEIILQALQDLQNREQNELISMAQSDANAPVFGNSDGEITIVEFFDYNCGFCKRAGETVRSAIADHSDVRIVMREFPILNEGSMFAARAALAAREQGKYEELHWALLESPRANEATVIAAAEELGLDIDQLRIDMESDEVNAHLQETRRITESLEINGTPAFLIEEQLVPGFITAEQLSNILSELRG